MIKSISSSVLDCIRVVVQPCLVIGRCLCDVKLTGDEELVLTVVFQELSGLIPSSGDEFVLDGAL